MWTSPSATARTVRHLPHNTAKRARGGCSATAAGTAQMGAAGSDAWLPSSQEQGVGHLRNDGGWTGYAALPQTSPCRCWAAVLQTVKPCACRPTRSPPRPCGRKGSLSSLPTSSPLLGIFSRSPFARLYPDCRRRRSDSVGIPLRRRAERSWPQPTSDHPFTISMRTPAPLPLHLRHHRTAPGVHFSHRQLSCTPLSPPPHSVLGRPAMPPAPATTSMPLTPMFPSVPGDSLHRHPAGPQAGLSDATSPP